MEHKRVWVYCRVAHGGADHFDPLEGQRLTLETYAKERGWVIVGSSSDIGSGQSFDRPGFFEFLDAVDDGAVDILLLRSLDRLSRDMNKVTWFWHLLREQGIQIHTIADGENEVDLTLYSLIREAIGKTSV